MKNQSILILIGFFFFHVSVNCQSLEKKLVQLDSILSVNHYQHKFNGVVLVAQNGNVLFKKAYGTADVEGTIPLTTQSSFNLASISKTFTAAMILMLKEEGKLQLEDKVQKHLPLFPYSELSIRHLLTHTHGMVEYFDFVKEYGFANDTLTNEKVLILLNKHKPELKFKPGEKFEYCNTGYLMLGLVLEKVAGTSIESFFTKRIVKPLRLKNTRIYNLKTANQPPNRVFGKKWENNTWSINDLTALDGVTADGNVYSSVEDLLKWDQALFSGKVLKKNTLKEAYTPLTFKKKPRMNYGLGWVVNEEGKRVSHSGSWMGFKTNFVRTLDNSLTFIFLSSGTEIAGAIAANELFYPNDWPKRPGSVAQSTGEVVELGTKYEIKSKVLNEDRTYWVRLPASYKNARHAPQSYPVLYVLDGKSVFSPIAGVVSFMSEKESVNFQIPEMIVVGIDTDNRIRDLTPNATNKLPDGSEAQTESQKLMMMGSGGGEAFLKFLTDELFPKIESDYRTLPYRVYVGHSLGGLTSTYTLLKHAGIFDGYLAIDPSLWWDGAKYVKEAPVLLKQHQTSKVQRYYVSVIDTLLERQGTGLHARSIHNIAQHLQAHASDNVQFKLDVIHNTDHSSIPLLSWYHGLQFIFEGYDVNHFAFLQNPDLIETHYAHLERNLGLKMSPPEDVFEILIHYLTSPDRFPDPEKALKVVKMALKYHPESPYLQEKLNDLEKN